MVDHKIVFTAYHDFNSNGRCQEVLKAAEKIGQVTFMSYTVPSGFSIEKNTNYIITGNGKRKYFQFVSKSIDTMKKIKPNIVIIHDNYCAAIIPAILKISPRPFIVYDSSELYIDKKPRGLSGTIAWMIQKKENKFISSADMVIAANLERAVIMKDFFHLKQQPFVFENIRSIAEEPDVPSCDQKFSGYLNDNRFVIIYAGGISKNRMTYELIKTVKSLGSHYLLLLAGQKQDDENELYNVAINSSSVDNVFYLGYLKRAELKYLFQRVNLSVSMFQQNTINNINCASGKLYESVFEGCPVLTSTNPPFLRLCKEYGFGISTDDLKKGIKEISENYSEYKDNALNFSKNVSPENLVLELANHILKVYNISARSRE